MHIIDMPPKIRLIAQRPFPEPTLPHPALSLGNPRLRTVFTHPNP